MRAIRFTTFAATALIAAASLSVGTAGLATAQVKPMSGIIGSDQGTGATLQAAEAQALSYLRGDYTGCKPPAIYYDYGQFANGTWYASVEENCTGYR